MKQEDDGDRGLGVIVTLSNVTCCLNSYVGIRYDKLDRIINLDELIKICVEADAIIKQFPKWKCSTGNRANQTS